MARVTAYERYLRKNIDSARHCPHFFARSLAQFWKYNITQNTKKRFWLIKHNENHRKKTTGTDEILSPPQTPKLASLRPPTSPCRRPRSRALNKTNVDAHREESRTYSLEFSLVISLEFSLVISLELWGLRLCGSIVYSLKLCYVNPGISR